MPEIGASVFIIPSDFDSRHERSAFKYRDERLVVLNDVSRKVIDGQRRLDPLYAFPYRVPTGAAYRMNDSASKEASVGPQQYYKPANPGFARIRIHDLKHTSGRRLQSTGVSH
ncbi:hypothetical protein WG219_10825 [Ectopseudomonas mendocina]|uniref:Uncharacterized protein n=1 Tax=Ectopseudomonas mendocina TaxID=300 RepID=A0ABZ2RUD5_ECTME